jgi:hypothetical protein
MVDEDKFTLVDSKRVKEFRYAKRMAVLLIKLDC